jgi:hypothetical protein
VTRCSICKTLIQPSEPTIVCTECDSGYHQECWERNGGCATYGCSNVPAVKRILQPAAIERTWGDEKECPACQRSIPSSVLSCRCGARFPWADPMTSMQYHAWVDQEALRVRNRRLFVVLFILSLFGWPAPLAGTVAGIQAFRNREEMVGENGPFLALGYGTAIIGLIYSLIFLLLYLGW